MTMDNLPGRCPALDLGQLDPAEGEPRALLIIDQLATAALERTVASSISEGAIPFTAATRRAPSCQHARRRYDGRRVHGVRRHIMASGVTSKAPHGGIFVFFAIGTRYVCRVNPDRTEMSAVAVIALKRQAVKPSSRQEVNGQLEDAALVAA